MPDISRRTAIKTLAFTSASLAIPASAQNNLSKLSKPIKLGVIADPHIGFVKNAETRLDAFLAEMKKEKPNALIQLGDFAHPNEKCKPSVDAFNNAHKHALHTIGNHDIRDHGLTRADCKKFWGIPAPYYTKVIDGLRIIILDGNEKGSPTHKGGYPSYIGKEQQQWLEKTLQDSKEPVLIVSHQPLAGNFPVDNYKDIQAILSKHSDKVILCINGHSHLDHLLAVDGISYLHVNSASYYWLGGKVRLAEYKDPLFATLTFDPHKKEVVIKGTETTWKKGTPEDVDYFKGDRTKLKGIVTPKISDRKISPSKESEKES